jgi:hypothetical protein
MRKSFVLLMSIVLFDDFLTASDDSSLSTVISIKRYKIGKFHFIDKASYIPLEMICENEVDSGKNDIEKPPPILSVSCIERLRRSASLFHFRINRASVTRNTEKVLFLVTEARFMSSHAAQIMQVWPSEGNVGNVVGACACHRPIGKTRSDWKPGGGKHTPLRHSP